MYAHLTISRIRHDGINLAKLGRFEKEKKILDQSERNILDLFFCEFDPMRVLCKKFIKKIYFNVRFRLNQDSSSTDEDRC